MLPLLRYTLTAIFLAASVGCLGLWGWSTPRIAKKVTATYVTKTVRMNAKLVGGVAHLHFRQGDFAASRSRNVLLFYFKDMHGLDVSFYPAYINFYGRFGLNNGTLHFPLWYPSLVFAVAAVGVLRLGKPFTVRSALVATAVVAGLLGMVAAL